MENGTPFCVPGCGCVRTIKSAAIRFTGTGGLPTNKRVTNALRMRPYRTTKQYVSGERAVSPDSELDLWPRLRSRAMAAKHGSIWSTRISAPGCNFGDQGASSTSAQQPQCLQITYSSGKPATMGFHIVESSRGLRRSSLERTV